MVYIVVLNWNNAVDTIACLDSIFKLTCGAFKIIVCDNASKDSSYNDIKEALIANQYLNNKSLVELNKHESECYCIPSDEDGLYLIQTGDNLGFAGGNNVGVRFALNQKDAKFIWLLNNDTEVEPNSLSHLVAKAESDSRIGICGSKLVYYHNRDFLQGVGGIYNPWLATTSHYKGMSLSSDIIDERDAEKNIDYIIGASMLLTVDFIKKVGLMNEEYFLYYEELDYCFRARNAGYNLGIASKSVVYHKEGATTSQDKGIVGDYYSVKNRLKFTKNFNKKYYIFVYFSIFAVAVNRLRRLQFIKFCNVVRVLFGNSQR